MNCEYVEELAFTYWKRYVNEKAFVTKLITKAMYEFARDNLDRDIDRLSNLCCAVTESG